MSGIDNSAAGQLVASQLSQAAYTSLEQYKSQSNPIVLGNWHVDTLNSDASANNQFITFVNNDTKQIVIAFKGTSFDNTSQIMSDLLNSGASAYKEIQTKADAAYTRIQNNYDYSGYEIITDGYSLGANICCSASFKWLWAKFTAYRAGLNGC